MVATDLTPESIALLQSSGDFTVTSVPPKTSAVRSALEDATAIITRSDFKLDAPLMEYAPQLRLIARMSAGLTGIDIEYATERGILVMNIPGVSAIAAAEHTLTLMLALNRKSARGTRQACGKAGGFSTGSSKWVCNCMARQSASSAWGESGSAWHISAWRSV